MAGPVMSLPAAVLRSAGLEVLGMGSGTMPPMDVLTGMLRELEAMLVLPPAGGRGEASRGSAAG